MDEGSGMLARGPARGEAGDDDSGAHCGVRWIQGSKSDYQLVSEARLRYSLAFRATFYFRWLDNDPPLQARAGTEGLASSSSPSILRQHNTTQDDSMTACITYSEGRIVQTLYSKQEFN